MSGYFQVKIHFFLNWNGRWEHVNEGSMEVIRDAAAEAVVAVADAVVAAAAAASTAAMAAAAAESEGPPGMS